MARVEVARAAQEDLERLIRSHSLPADTRERVKNALRGLERFPMIGAELPDRWRGFRFVLGPWRWFLIVYRYDEADDRVAVVTMQDARSSEAATASPGA